VKLQCAEQKSGLPFVSVLVPMRNEERYIAQCLDSLIRQDYPADKYEIIVIDGMSEDTSVQIAQRVARENSGRNLKIVSNPRRIVPAALNVGLSKAVGDVIVRVDAHCYVPADFIRLNVETLLSKNVDCVGGPIETVGNGYIGKAVALAMSSSFGVGGARFRCSKKSGYVDTVPFAAYRREVFALIGGFDETLPFNEDEELNLRLRLSGGKVFMTPQIKSTYYVRRSLRALGKQYFWYGRGKVRLIRKHHRPAALRNLVPGIFVGSLLLLGLVGSANPVAKSAFLGISLLYLFANLCTSLYISVHRGLQYLPILPLAFATLHLSYGLGFWRGCLDILAEHLRCH